MKQIMKPGRYFVGDPCYVYREGWSDLLTATDYLEMPHPTKADIIAVGGTMHGDGLFTDELGNEYSVDAGVIGVVHESQWECKETDFEHLGVIRVFDNEFVFEAHDGVFIIGSVYIDTRGEDADDYDDQYGD